MTLNENFDIPHIIKLNISENFLLDLFFHNLVLTTKSLI